jgi:ornithine decarboxylase
MHPEAVRRRAAEFVSRFDGTVLYAVKANPHPVVIEAVVDGGVRHFDAASIGEIELIDDLVPEADISFNNPVKPVSAIREAYHDFGVRDFVVDHLGELEKVLESTGPGVTIQVRVGQPNSEAVVDLSSKFGVDFETANLLLAAIADGGARPAVSFHAGWQAQNPAFYLEMIEAVAALPIATELAYLNVGGGFPSVLMPEGLSLDDYFEAIAHASIPLRAEPGSVLAAPGASILSRVLLRKDDAVYLNDGIYGGLNEHAHYSRPGNHRVLDGSGRPRSGAPVSVTVFGPTCDSLDVLPNRYSLPDDTETGDWIVFEQSGAYSNALTTNFNHLGQMEFVEVQSASQG